MAGLSVRAIRLTFRSDPSVVARIEQYYTEFLPSMPECFQAAYAILEA